MGEFDPARMAELYNGVAEQILVSPAFTKRIEEVVEKIAQAFIDKLNTIILDIGLAIINRPEFAGLIAREVDMTMVRYHDRIERMINERLFTAMTAAEFLGITPEHFSRLDRAGLGPEPVNKDAKGKSRRWTRSSLMAYAKDGGPHPMPKKKHR